MRKSFGLTGSIFGSAQLFAACAPDPQAAASSLCELLRDFERSQGQVVVLRASVRSDAHHQSTLQDQSCPRHGAQYGGGSPDFFAESLVDWPRMRAGFDLLMEQFPKSAWNQANDVVFACRAEDAGAYFKWRKTVDAGEFERAAPPGVSIEVCDARFTRKI